MKSLRYYSLVYGVTFVLVIFLFRISAAHAFAKLDVVRVETVTHLLVEGDFSRADTELKTLETSRTADQDVVKIERETWQRLQDDLLFARDYFEKNGNTTKAEAVSRVLASYATPKEMLVAVQLLLKQGERDYARKLYDRVGRIAPDYKGYLDLREYFTN